MLQRVLLLGFAGALGTVARHGLAGLIHRWAGTSYPCGTLAVNPVGCFMAGLLWSLFEHRWPVPSETRVLVLVGFMGAFTTFSSFIMETNELFQAAGWFPAMGNILLQNGLGLMALVGGFALGRLV